MHRVPQRVFVYGTLKPGERNDHVAHRAGLMGLWRARLVGFDLYHLSPEGFPAVVRGRGVVDGWVLLLRDLAPLDLLEDVDAHPPLYRRERGRLAGGGSVWVYVYARRERLLQRGAHLCPQGSWQESFDSKENRRISFAVGGSKK